MLKAYAQNGDLNEPSTDKFNRKVHGIIFKRYKIRKRVQCIRAPFNKLIDFMHQPLKEVKP